MKSSKQDVRKILVTSALPYGNGPIHLGHAVEYVQTDIFVRFMKLRGHKATYICADDQHGSPIMIAAQNHGVSPESYIDQIRQEHISDFSGLGIGFDHYGQTHCEENRRLCNEIYYAAKDKRLIESRPESQLFDEAKGMFLADRFVKGQCPKCEALNQYGDNCEVCGATYAAHELRNPVSQLSGTTPVLKETVQLYFKLSSMQDFLKTWIENPEHTDPITRNKVLEWHQGNLADWCISRDAPYFGYEIPDLPGKYFYVWLDAPVGYMAATEQWCQLNKKSFADIWRNQADNEYEIYHFIGKDIINFHCVFWPALLSSAGFRAPSSVFVHGFLTVNGKKMSKRDGTFITLENYLAHFSPEYLRYYLASKLSDKPDDLDLNFGDFVARCNTDLVGKLVNIASRTAPFIEQKFDGKLAAHLDDPQQLLLKFAEAGSQIAGDFEARRFSHAIRRIMDLADLANQYIAAQAPWLMAKDSQKSQQLHQVCSLAINLFRTIMVYLSPVVPQLAERVWDFLNIDAPDWAQAGDVLVDHEIKPYARLIERINADQVKALISPTSKAALTEEAPEEAANLPVALEQSCSLAQFQAVDLRVAKIVHAERVSGHPKIAKLTVDIGTLPKTVYAKLNSRYTSTELIGRLTIVLANLEPRAFSFGTSEAMLVGAKGNGDDEIYLFSPDIGARPGMRLV